MKKLSKLPFEALQKIIDERGYEHGEEYGDILTDLDEYSPDILELLMDEKFTDYVYWIMVDIAEQIDEFLAEEEGDEWYEED